MKGWARDVVQWYGTCLACASLWWQVLGPLKIKKVNMEQFYKLSINTYFNLVKEHAKENKIKNY